MAGRFIKLYENILKWEWYGDINTSRLFIHLLLIANYKDCVFRGQVIKRGQVVRSVANLASETRLTVRQVRDSLKHLQMTNEVTSSSCPRYTVFTIVKYDDYQASDKQDDKQVTNKVTNKRQTERQTNDKQNDNEYRTIESIELQKDRNIDSPSERERTAKRFTPPTRDDIINFCQENGIMIDPDRFMDYYASRGWKVGTSPMKDWKAAVRNWWRRDGEARPPVRSSSPTPSPAPARKVIAQDYEQRDYSKVMDSAMAEQERRVLEHMRRKGNYND